MFKFLLITLLFGCGIEKAKKTLDSEDKIEVEAEKGDTGDAGKDGESPIPLKGQDGKNCEITQEENGFTITCHKSKVYVQNPPRGQRGEAGQNGTNGVNGTNGTNGADGEQGEQGEAGESCRVEPVTNGYVLTCPDTDIYVRTTERIKVCAKVSLIKHRTLLLTIQEINSDEYKILHIGKCLIGRNVQNPRGS